MNNITEQERQAIEAAAKIEFEKEVDFCFDKGTTAGSGERMFLKGAEFALTELRKPEEDLIEQILAIMDKESKSDESDAEYLLGGQFATVAHEIAKLAPFRGVNTESVLEQLESIKRDANNLHSGNVAHQRVHLLGAISYLENEIKNAENNNL